MPASRIPLDLYAEITTSDGTRYKWDANQSPAARLLNVTFSDKIGEGFSVGGGQLARRVDQDYPDLNLIDNVTLTGADGSVAYEGRLSAMPRELGDRHSIGVTLTGWMAHAAGKRFVMPIVDREVGPWGEMPRERNASLLGSAVSTGDFSYTSGQGGVIAALPNQALGAQTLAEVWYQAPTGVTIARVAYRGKTTTLPAGWTQTFAVTDNRTASSPTAIAATLDDTLRSAAVSPAGRYLLHQTYSNGSAATPAAGSSVQFSKIAVYGSHTITLRTGDTSEPDGVYASDVIRWIAENYAPKLDTSGVQDTTYVIQHLSFRDPITPFDSFLAVNAFHLWHLGVWENKRLDFRPYDLTDYDWEIRTDDPGTSFSQQGQSTENLFNGIAVTYTDLLTGSTERLTPDVYADLQDASPSNPWNLHGEDEWDELTLSRATLADQALQIGRATLAERNRPRAPGTITVRGYIRDRAGNYQPYWKVRAGDTIAITNHPNDAPRLIVETEKDVDSQTVKIAVDMPFSTVEAMEDRVENALTAAGLN